MRRLMASLMIAAAVASPIGAQGGGGTPRASACALLTREAITQASPLDPKVLDTILRIGAQEDPVGTSGSACEYGDVGIQVDAFAAPARTESEIAKTWMRVGGIGDAAYFRDNRGMWAELYLRTGSRTLTIQMSVPTGRTAESIRPNVLALARALLPKLQ